MGNKTPQRIRRFRSEQIEESINRLVEIMDNGREYICYVCENEADARMPCPVCFERSKDDPDNPIMTMKKRECLMKMMDARETAIENERGW